MDREEAIKLLEHISIAYTPTDAYGDYDDPQPYEEAMDMAIESLQAEATKAVPPSLADVYKWERDIALSQLEEYGIRFAEKKRDDLVEVVRCKDCIHKYVSGNGITQYYICDFMDAQYEDDGYCSHGERREDGDSE